MKKLVLVVLYVFFAIVGCVGCDEFKLGQSKNPKNPWRYMFYFPNEIHHPIDISYCNGYLWMLDEERKIYKVGMSGLVEETIGIFTEYDDVSQLGVTDDWKAVGGYDHVVFLFPDGRQKHVYLDGTTYQCLEVMRGVLHTVVDQKVIRVFPDGRIEYVFDSPQGVSVSWSFGFATYFWGHGSPTHSNMYVAFNESGKLPLYIYPTVSDSLALTGDGNTTLYAMDLVGVLKCEISAATKAVYRSKYFLTGTTADEIQ